ncbi:MAG TPA: molybdopterin converting factor subunit 1 [Acidobacteriaceae bacterium]|jgi:molybdopterin synthase catalytic subunit|nr:molybdopterin converting factor subunit 1 [Acidobacteriaceae bacterium]
MKVRVLFFGMLKDTFAHDSETLELPETARVQQVLQHYTLQEPQIKTLLSALAVAVNQQYAQATQILQDGDEVALLPPVSGGALDEQEPSLFACIQDEPILADPLVSRLKWGEDGAVVVFDGIVRNHTRGRRTHYLVYEAYREMALEQMRRLLQDAKHQFAIRDAVAVHRLGRLEVGDTSVLIAVASAHRAQAFDACRWIIDTLKKTVPIWKKEYFEDGAVWADGEPFPIEMMAMSRRQQ